MKCCFTIDVEDWFHILDVSSSPAIDKWDSMPSRVETDFRRLLDTLAEYEVTATCFFLGWIAQKYPHLVQEAVRAGHEIASHGYGHELIYNMPRDRFLDDARRSRQILEDIAGYEISGYRGAGFSVIENTPWFFDTLVEAGYKYDSTLFPAHRGHGGNAGGNPHPHKVGTIYEIPISVAPWLGRRLCFFGGGYLRLFPLSLIMKKAREVLADNRPVVWYIHPRELDPAQPRLPMPLKRRFKSYVNLGGTEKKLRSILEYFEFQTIISYIESHAVK